MIVAGVDVGSTMTKVILMKREKKVIGRGITYTGAHIINAAHRALEEACKNAGVEQSEVTYTVGTGYGRFRIPFGHTQVTEISCHAKGAWYLFPHTIVVLDIGGQDTKAIKVGPEGNVIDFTMNDKCAAGTGRFLEVCASVLSLSLNEIGEVSLKATNPVKLSNVCTVFVESEITSHLAKGKKREDILSGVHSAIAAKSIGLMRRIGVEPEVTFTGGVSRNIGMVSALSERLQMNINVSPDSIFMGAIGAALYGLETSKSFTSWEE